MFEGDPDADRGGAGVLRLLALSPRDLEGVLQSVADEAARLCGATFSGVLRREADVLRLSATFPANDRLREERANPLVTIAVDDPVSIASLVVRERRVVLVDDALEEPVLPRAVELYRLTGSRSQLGLPLVVGERVLGALMLHQADSHAFTSDRVARAQMFADQAAIAIDHANLFDELQDALDRQTATADLLRLLASSPGQQSLVLQSLVETAMRLCDAHIGFVGQRQGEAVTILAASGVAADDPLFFGRSWAIAPDDSLGSTLLSQRVSSIEDSQDPEFLSNRSEATRDWILRLGIRAEMAVPLLHAGAVVGLLLLARTSPGAFSARELETARSFGDQAALALRNHQLFQDLGEALAQQTATAEVLQSMSRSAFDLPGLLDGVVGATAELLGTGSAILWQRDKGGIRLAAGRFRDDNAREFLMGRRISDDLQHSIGEALRWKTTIRGISYPDDPTLEDSPWWREYVAQFGVTSFLTAPMIANGETIGLLQTDVQEVRHFTDREAALLQTFADQAAIAIENARLLAEIESRNTELADALHEQTAVADVLSVMSTSPTDLTKVLDVVLQRACELCGVDAAVVQRVDGDEMVNIALRGSSGSNELLGGRTTIQPAHRDRRPIHIVDTAEVLDVFPLVVQEMVRRDGGRTMLALPLCRGDELVGGLVLARHRVAAFTDAQIALLQTFADQAAIAIENARLFEELEHRNDALSDALRQQTASAEVLSIIAASPTDVRPVFDEVLDRAATLCDAEWGAVIRLYQETSVVEAVWGLGDAETVGTTFVSSQRTRELRDGRQVIFDDALDASEMERLDAPAVQTVFARHGIRSCVATPVIGQDGELAAIITIGRTQLRQFTHQQLDWLVSFASQAAIAIENGRLFAQLESRNTDLSDALRQQTATAEVLKIISGAPTDLTDVLDLVLKRACELCDADEGVVQRAEGAVMVNVAAKGMFRDELLGASTPVSAILRRGVPLHMRDVSAPATLATFPPLEQSLIRRGGAMTMLAVPMMRDGHLVGVVTVSRSVVRPFTPAQIALLQTFADQAAIAIENARLFQELENRNSDLTMSLRQQTAMAEVLRIISGARADLSNVLNVVLSRAVELCDAQEGLITRVDGETMVHVAAHGEFTRGVLGLVVPVNNDLLNGRAVHFPDLSEPAVLATLHEAERDVVVRGGLKTMLAAPMYRDTTLGGVVVLMRNDIRPFSPSQITLLQTFADQAAIAIENARLFQELENRNTELTDSLAHQTATADVLSMISTSPTELRPVFQAVLDRAAQMCDAQSGALLRLADGQSVFEAGWGAGADELLGTSVAPSAHIDALRRGERVLIDDLLAPSELANLNPALWPTIRKLGLRTSLTVPVLGRGGDLVAMITLGRTEARPFTEQQLAAVDSFAHQAAIAIDNGQLLGELRTRTEELSESVSRLRGLLTIGQAVSSTLDLESVLQTIVATATELAEADTGAIAPFDDSDDAGGVLNVMANIGVGLDDGSWARVSEARLADRRDGNDPGTRRFMEALGGEPWQVADLATSDASGAPFGPRLRTLMIEAGTRAQMLAPLVVDGHMRGVLILTRRTPGLFSAAVVEMVKTFAAQSAVALYNAALFREVAESTRIAQEANASKGSFLATMSHEIRTPLNAVIGMTGLLLDTTLDARQREFTEVIRTSGEGLLAIINDILDFSKIDAGRMDLEDHPFELRPAIESAFDLISESAARKGLELALLIEPDVPSAMRGDVTRLRQVLVNLLGNAVKFTEHGEIVLTVELAGDERLHIAVRDTGIGIAADRLHRLFKAFSQVDSSTTRRYGGTGLGLAVSRQLVTLMGGELWVESEEGHGSTFHVTIAARPAPDGFSRPRVVPPDLHAKRLLVVDDSEINRRTVSLQARAWGVHVTEASSGPEALARLDAGEHFDIAILDLHMPEMNGATLGSHIRQRRDDLPLVLFSSLGQTPGSHRVFDAVLTKPVKQSSFFDLLVDLLTSGPATQRHDTAASTDRNIADQHPLRVLVAEDNPVNQQIAVLTLEQMGYRADVVANGLEAVEAIDRHVYDVVLMDVQMPEMDGLEATRLICTRWERDARPRIVAMTANAMTGDRQQCLDAGMDDYLAKPIRASELADALRRVPTGRFRPLSHELDQAALSRLHELTGGPDSAAFRALVTALRTTEASLLTDLRCDDPTIVMRAAHTLKSNASSFGATELAELSRELEMLARAGSCDAPVAVALIERIAVSFGDLLRQLANMNGAA